MSSTAIGVSLSMSSRIRRGGGEVDVERVLVTASPTTLTLNQTRREVAGRFLGMKKRFHGTVAMTKAEVVDEKKQKMSSRNLRVGLICGGPSAERGISLNSVRSVLDHIQVLENHLNIVFLSSSVI